MDMQLSDAEMADLRRLSKEYAPLKGAIATLEQHQNRLDASFDTLCADKLDVPLVYPSGDPQSFWCVTLTGLQSDLCQNQLFQQRLQDYQRSFAKKASSFKAIVASVMASGMPLDPSMASLVVCYILKTGLENFCHASEASDKS